MRPQFAVVAVLAMATYARAQESVRTEIGAAIQELKPLCALEETTDRDEEQVLRAPASAAVMSALTSEAAFWTFLTDPATPYLDRMVAAQHGARATTLAHLPTLWKTAAELNAVPVGVYPSPCEFLRSAALNPAWWAQRQKRSYGAVASKPESRLIAGRTVALPVEAVDYPVTPSARARAPWLWQMRRAFNVLMPGVRQHFAEPSRYPAMAETAWIWQPVDHHETRERLEALRTGPRNADWVEIVLRLALDGGAARDADLVRDLYVFGNDSYHFEELVHAAQILVLQRTDRWDVAFNAAHRAAEMGTTNFSRFSKVLKPIRTAIATRAIARWALNTGVKERDRYGFASVVCRLVDDPPFKPNSAIMNSATGNDAEVTSSLAAFEAWFAGTRPRLERQAEIERVRWNAVASELGRRIE